MKEILSDFSSALKIAFRLFKETYKDFRQTRKLARESAQVIFTKPILDEKTQRTIDIIRNKSIDNMEKLPRYTDPKIQAQVDSYNHKVSETIKKDLENLPPLNNLELSIHNKKELENLMISGK